MKALYTLDVCDVCGQPIYMIDEVAIAHVTLQKDAHVAYKEEKDRATARPS